MIDGLNLSCVCYLSVSVVPGDPPAAPPWRRRVGQVHHCEADAHPARQRLLGEGAPREDRRHQKEHQGCHTCKS